ncbi:unnamed protein product [Paramecium sonneborni]|uniref:Uncharacterized protein n=1 Tax=Paramecium sonneborni TaxID=65129 RepID=A0A8S1R922_9CILI|nr:unnamed protein product [Paramecium sonneborni]
MAVKKLTDSLFYNRLPIIRRAFGSVLIDQIVWRCYLLCHYLIIINLREWFNFQSNKNNFLKVMIINWQIWSAAQIIMVNFTTLLSFLGQFYKIFWNIYLSYISHK